MLRSKLLLIVAFVLTAFAGTYAQTFTLKSNDIGGQFTKKQEFNGLDVVVKIFHLNCCGKMLQKEQRALPLRYMTQMHQQEVVFGIG
jgi:hypothetical protein